MLPDTPLYLLSPDGSTVHVDNASSPAYSSAGNGTSPKEQFLAYHFPDAANLSPIQAGHDACFQSMQTGLWCRLTPSLGLLCDQANRTGAVAMTYSGSGLSFQGTPLVGMAGQLLQLNSSASREATTLMPQTAPPPAGGEPGPRCTAAQAAAPFSSPTIAVRCIWHG